ncbi:hypothetical protein GGU11DRAFT_830606, partial [Lentinula aff. detonsa]
SSPSSSPEPTEIPLPPSRSRSNTPLAETPKIDSTSPSPSSSEDADLSRLSTIRKESTTPPGSRPKPQAPAIVAPAPINAPLTSLGIGRPSTRIGEAEEQEEEKPVALKPRPVFPKTPFGVIPSKSRSSSPEESKLNEGKRPKTPPLLSNFFGGGSTPTVLSRPPPLPLFTIPPRAKPACHPLSCPTPNESTLDSFGCPRSKRVQSGLVWPSSKQTSPIWTRLAVLEANESTLDSFGRPRSKRVHSGLSPDTKRVRSGLVWPPSKHHNSWWYCGSASKLTPPTRTFGSFQLAGGGTRTQGHRIADWLEEVLLTHHQLVWSATSAKRNRTTSKNTPTASASVNGHTAASASTASKAKGKEKAPTSVSAAGTGPSAAPIALAVGGVETLPPPLTSAPLIHRGEQADHNPLLRWPAGTSCHLCFASFHTYYHILLPPYHLVLNDAYERI